MDWEREWTPREQKDGYPSQPAGLECQAGWVSGDSVCYRAIEEEQSWKGASEQCDKFGAVLACVELMASTNGTIDVEVLMQWKNDSDTPQLFWVRSDMSQKLEDFHDCLAVRLPAVVFAVRHCNLSLPGLCQKGALTKTNTTSRNPDSVGIYSTNVTTFYPSDWKFPFFALLLVIAVVIVICAVGIAFILNRLIKWRQFHDNTTTLPNDKMATSLNVSENEMSDNSTLRE